MRGPLPGLWASETLAGFYWSLSLSLSLFLLAPFHFISFFFKIFSHFLLLFLLLFKYSCLPSPPQSLPPKPSPSPLIPPPLGFVHVSFIVVPENSSPFPPHYPLPLPHYLALEWLITWGKGWAAIFMEKQRKREVEMRVNKFLERKSIWLWLSVFHFLVPDLGFYEILLYPFNQLLITLTPTLFS